MRLRVRKLGSMGIYAEQTDSSQMKMSLMIWESNLQAWIQQYFLWREIVLLLYVRVSRNILKK